MSRDLDTRARQASNSLKRAVEQAEFSSVPPATPVPRRPVVAALRPAMVMALLVIGSAVGFALTRDSSPAATTIASTPTTVAPIATSVPTEPEAAPPTTAALSETSSPPPTTVPVDVTPPHLEVTSPADGAETTEKTITFEGSTEPGAQVFAGPWEAEVDESGQWHIVLILNEGSNRATFKAIDGAGNEATASITVHYIVEKPATTTTTIKKELAEFSAHATYGSCAETPPYDIYYGTGEPGSMVHITSEYGSASVEVNEDGTWEKKVVFEAAPENKAFSVKVKDDFGRKKLFEFIHKPA